MFYASRVFAHALVIESKRGLGLSPQPPEARGPRAKPSALGNFGDLLPK